MKLEALNRQGKRVDLTSTPSVQKLSVEIVAEEFGISREQVRRYVALTNLDSALLKMVDENKIALRPAVQISYMKKQDQKEIIEAIESIDATPNCASVTFSIIERKDVKKDFILSRVSLDSNTVSFSSSSVSIFACFSATSDSTQDDVSNPDANPLNDIVMCFLRGNKL